MDTQSPPLSLRSNGAVDNALRRICNEDSSPWQSHQQGRLLEQAKQFEHDYDNDNYSDYVEDASVHAVD